MWRKKTAREQVAGQPARSALALALEARMMFDGAVAATAVEAADATAADTSADQGGQADAPAHDSAAENLAATPSGTSDNRQEVVFVDSNVKDYQQLVSSLKPGTEVVVLDANKDGLQQIADYLDGRSGIDAIHIFSHGDVGKIQLGNDWLDRADLAARSALLESIGQSLDSQGDILLYGCQVGADGEGQAFIDGLVAATGADVAASSDRTGAAALGGDWVLESTKGVIESRELAMPDYTGILAAFSEDFTNDPLVGGVSTSFTHMLGGVSYTFTFTSDGDGGSFNVDPMGGVGNSSSLTLWGVSGGLGAERVTITRTDGANFTFGSLFVNNTFLGAAATIAGYDNGGLVTSQNVGVNVQGTFNFNVGVDEIRITSDDLNLNIDNFVGDTNPPSVSPTLSATAANPTFTENGIAVDLFGAVTANTNDAGQTFSGMTLTVTNVSNGASELLIVNGVDIGLNNGNSGTIAGIGNYSVSVVAGTATVTLTGMTRTNAQMGTLVDGIAYRNTSDNPGSVSRVVTVTGITDSGASNNTASLSIASTVSVVPGNDAPSLSPANNTTSYTENGAGAVLSPALTISDPDSTSFQGATVTISDFRAGDVLSVGSNPGGFTVSYDTGTGVLTLSGGTGSLGHLQAALQSISYSSTSDDPTFGGTDGTRQINFAVTDSAGESSSAATAQVSITGVNDAPTLSGGPYVWAGTSEDATSTAVTVSSLLGSLTVSDPDSSNLGIAITGSTGSGTWEYSTDGTTWNGVGSVSGGAALLLSAGSQLRYIPAQNGETANLTFRAWDRNIGTASTNSIRNTADTSTNGGSSAFSTGTAQASLTVSAVNDAPVLTPGAPTLTGLTDGDINNPGQSVSSIVGSSISDVDTGAVTGIAISGLNPGNGTWQYSLDGGASWQDVGAVAASNALLLRATDRVRFVPDGANGTSASLTYHAWDQSGATSGQQGTKVDASTTGGSAPFSSASDTASILVTQVNDAPVVTTSGGNASFVEGDNVASTPVVIDSGITVSDDDSTLLSSATVTIINARNDEDVLAFTNDGASMGDITGSYDSSTGVLTLTSASGASAAQWQAALRSVTYGNTSESPIVANRTISFSVNDGNSSSLASVRDVTVALTNDAPVVNVPPSITVTEDVASAITGISFSDADAGSGSVTVTLSVGSGSLAATSGGGVTVGGTSSTLTLTGSIANINTFIAGSNLVYVPAANATGSVVVSVNISDNGLSGGGVKTDSETVTLAITPVNDAPNITAPGSISVNEDVSQPLTGISFSDVDAGSGIVTVTFSVASGTLSALSGSGVTVGGTASALTLTGTLANINAFVASGSVSFLTASNATSNVALSLSINDGGNTGSGGDMTASTTVTLAVNAVNDAPVNAVPGGQSVLQDGVLIFSTGNGNAIVISDVDAGGGTVQVTLTATNGLITLGSITGLVFSVGSGTGDATMTFDGSIADINAALAGLTFSPTAGYHGAASLQVVTNDLGLSGGGGAQTDSDTIAINVQQPNPSIVSVAAGSPNGTYKVGDTVTITVTYDQAVTVSGGVPRLLLETGTVDREALYVSGSGSNTLTFAYVVQAGDISGDLDYAGTGALSLNGASIASVSLGSPAFTTLPTPGAADSLGANADLVIDGVQPTVTSVTVPANGTYGAGQNLDFTVNFSQAVTVDTSGGTPRIAITLDGGGTVFASYVGGSGTSALVFRLTITSGQFDTNGISVGGSIQANGGTLRNAVGNAAVPALSNVGPTSGVLVDALAPTASIVVNGTPSATSGSVSFTVSFSEAVSGVDASDFSLLLGGSASGTLQSVVQVDARTFLVTVGNVTGQGSLGLVLSADGSGISDVSGNAMGQSASTAGFRIGSQIDGDPEFRSNPPIAPPPLPNFTVDRAPPNPPAPLFTSPLIPPSLFHQSTLGSGIPTMGDIFINNGATAQSFIAQVFGSGDGFGDGSGAGFLGFGGGDANVFGSSSFASLFSKDVPQESAEINPLWRGGAVVGERIFGAPTLGQQLQEINDNEQRQVRELALALGQIGADRPQA